MKNAEIISRLLFDWDEMQEPAIRESCRSLSPKLLRWLGANHPDNRTRRIFFELTNVAIGEGTVINQNFIVSDDYAPLLFIGKNVAISPNVTVICASGPNNSALNDHPYVQSKLICHKEVTIQDNVWIGANVTILPGVTIGENSVIGAGAIVTKDIKANSIYAGNPAKFIKSL